MMTRDIALEMLVTPALDKDDQKLLALITEARRRRVAATAAQLRCPLIKRAGTVYAVGDSVLEINVLIQTL